MPRKKNTIGKEIEKIEKKVDKEVKEVEQWIIERRKFFIKLAWVVGLTAVLLLISNIYLKIKGFA